MADLYPTKTRLALLQAVADGVVLIDPYGQAMQPPDGRWCTFRRGELVRAGWAERPAVPDARRWIPAVLTDAGRAVLDGRTP